MGCTQNRANILSLLAIIISVKETGVYQKILECLQQKKKKKECLQQHYSQ
jgi:hypothetical protein